MKLKDPDWVTVANDNCDSFGFYGAQDKRAESFWDVLERDFLTGESPEKGRTDAEINENHAQIKRDMLDTINGLADDLANKKIFSPLSFLDAEDTWEKIKFILAFDTSFSYVPEEHQDARDWRDHVETDYLDGETTFRYDVVKACDRLAIEGAACAKLIGSDTYQLWTDAMLKLAHWNEQVQCKAADDIINALEQIWADLRTWIHMNAPHSKAKPAKKPHKSKK